MNKDGTNSSAVGYIFSKIFDMVQQNIVPSKLEDKYVAVKHNDSKVCLPISAVIL